MSRRSVASDLVEIVRDHLSRGVTGSLHVRDDRGEWVLFVMQGEIIAAHGPADGHQVVRRLFNGGALSAKQADHFNDELNRGEMLENLLIGRVPEDLFLDLLGQRFRQNVLEFVSCAGPIEYTPLEAVFVENIQTGHDSHDLLDSLAHARDRTIVLRREANNLLVRPGTESPKQVVHARLLDLADPERLLQSLLDLSPFEDGVSLVSVAEMLEQGVIELLDTNELIPTVVPADGAATAVVSEPEPRLDAEPPVEPAQDADASDPLADVPDLFSALDDIAGAEAAVAEAAAAEAAAAEAAAEAAAAEAAAAEAAAADAAAAEAAAAEAAAAEAAAAEAAAAEAAAAEAAAAEAAAAEAAAAEAAAAEAAAAEAAAAEAAAAEAAVDAAAEAAETAAFDAMGLDDTDIVSLETLDADLLQPISDIGAVGVAASSFEYDHLPEVPDESEQTFEEELRVDPRPTLEPLEAVKDELVDTMDPDPSASDPAEDGDDDHEGDEDEDEEEDDDPDIADAIRRAKDIQARREAAAAQTADPALADDGPVAVPPGFDFHGDLPDDEMAFFEDQDYDRGGGQGTFVTEQTMLDKVDLSAEGMEAFQRAMQLPTDSRDQDDDGPLEMGEASEEEANAAVALNFSGPRLDEEDIRRKISVVNEVLAAISAALDDQNGKGSGRVSAQILVDGPPTRFSVLFRSVQVDSQGRMDADRMLKNLGKRPPAEHRRLINEGLLDLIQRALSTSVDELEEEKVDHMLEKIAGYQQRLGL